MKHKINAAVRRTVGALGADGAVAGQKIHIAGNQAAHGGPGLDVPEEEIIEALTLALEQLDAFGRE